MFLSASATDSMSAVVIFFLSLENSFSSLRHLRQDQRKAKERIELIIMQIKLLLDNYL